MKKLGFVLFALALFAPALTAQTAATFTGKWEGTLTPQRPDGTDGNPSPALFQLTQKGADLTGTAGPPDQQTKIEKGVVKAGKATFEVNTANGAIWKFALTIVKGHLQGGITIERDGAVRGKGKIDAGKAK